MKSNHSFLTKPTKGIFLHGGHAPEDYSGCNTIQNQQTLIVNNISQ